MESITGQAESGARDLVIARYDRTASMPEPMVVANPVPIAFWQRDIVWRDETNYGSGSYSLGSGVWLSGEVRPHNMGQGRARACQFPYAKAATQQPICFGRGCRCWNDHRQRNRPSAINVSWTRASATGFWFVFLQSLSNNPVSRVGVAGG